MSSIINQYSGVILLLVIVTAVTAFILSRVPKKRRPFVLFVAFAVLLVAGFLFFQPETDNVSSSEVQILLAQGNGRPVLLELYSDY
ncbi:MAG TPA: hypothetical protein EYP41_05520 [Anaerolineae bacterium]|nr:hypothetical protein [Anaerolineae bacterium]HIP73133.1 hypothetical protein [Anaerolineae bacterium]